MFAKLKPAQDLLLYKALLGNALFSDLSGFILLLAGRPISQLMGIDAGWALNFMGLALIGYAFILFFLTRQPQIAPWQAWGVIGGDLLWVIGSILLIWFDPFSLTPFGQTAVIVIADIVALFAITQYVGWRRWPTG